MHAPVFVEVSSLPKRLRVRQAVCYSLELGMVTETRCISPIEDLTAVELVCTDSSCGFVYTLRVEHIDNLPEQACPRCNTS